MTSRCGAACAVLAALVLAGCGSSGASSSTTAARTTSPATTTTAAASSTINPLGKAVTLPIGGTKLAVTVRKLLDPVAAPKQTGPYAGDRVVAVELTLHNVGTKPYAGSPSDYSSLMTAGGERPPISPSKVRRCAKIGSGSVKLAAGGMLSSCIAYDIGGPQQAASFTLAPSSKTTAKWSLH
jgi:hypothetical protein